LVDDVNTRAVLACLRRLCRVAISPVWVGGNSTSESPQDTANELFGGSGLGSALAQPAVVYGETADAGLRTLGRLLGAYEPSTQPTLRTRQVPWLQIIRLAGDLHTHIARARPQDA
jgi:hypothetical protein